MSALVSQGACEQAVLCARGAADGAPALFRNLVEACDLRSELHRLVRAPLSAAERASLEEYVRERGGVRADPMLRLISMVPPAGAPVVALLSSGKGTKRSTDSRVRWISISKRNIGEDTTDGITLPEQRQSVHSLSAATADWMWDSAFSHACNERK